MVSRECASYNGGIESFEGSHGYENVTGGQR
jgi:hypothetical protein